MDTLLASPPTQLRRLEMLGSSHGKTIDDLLPLLHNLSSLVVQASHVTSAENLLSLPNLCHLTIHQYSHEFISDLVTLLPQLGLQTLKLDIPPALSIPLNDRPVLHQVNKVGALTNTEIVWSVSY